LVDDPGLAHFGVEIVPFASPFSHSRENREAAVTFRDVIDQLKDDDRLTDARPAEGANLAALGKRTNEIDDLDAGLENRRTGVLVSQLGSFAMNRVTFLELDRAAIIDRIAGDIKNATESPLAHRDADRAAGIAHRHPALQTFRGRHGDRANPIFAEMLLHFESQFGRGAVHLVFDFKRVVDPRQPCVAAKFHVHHGTDDLNDISFIHNSS
jgi:hypothetical protein